MHEAFENAVAIARHQGVAAVLAAVGIGRRNPGQGAAARLAHRTKGAVLGQQAFHAIEHRFVQSHVNHLALATAVALVQGHQNANHAVQGRQGVANADPHTHWYAARLGGEVAQAPHGFGHDTKAGLVTPWPGLPITTDAQHNQPWVELLQHLRAQAPALHGPGAKVFDQHIGIRGELAHDVLSLGVTQIQGQGALVARLHLPPHRGAVFEQAPFAQGVTYSGGFDLDDVGTKVGQGFGRKRPGNQLTEFHDLDACQGTRGRRGRIDGRL